MTKPLITQPVRTEVFHPGEDLAQFIIKHIPAEQLREGHVLAVTSKIVSLAENRLVPLGSIDKKDLIRQEADYYLGEIGHGVSLTITHGLMLPASGIDESNSEHGDYILYPQDPFQSATHLWQTLRTHYGLQKLGILLTDSRSGPLRLGVVGVSLAFAGFHPVKNKIGESDIFGRPLKLTKINLVDSLAAGAVLMMGEGDEQCPLAVIENAPVEFTDSPLRSDLEVALEDDMYLPLYKHMLE